MSEAPTFRIRPAVEADLPFVVHSWLHSYASTGAKASSSSVYWDHHPNLVKAALGRSSVLVACPDDDPESILGWICIDRVGKHGLIHYVYVKHPFRRLGIASALLAPLRPVPMCITHKTSVTEKMNLPSYWVHNPYLFNGA